MCKGVKILENKNVFRGFPGGSVVKNLPAGSEDAVVQEDPTCCAEQLSPCATTVEPMPCNSWSPCALQPVLNESNPWSLQLEKNSHRNKDPAQPKINK